MKRLIHSLIPLVLLVLVTGKPLAAQTFASAGSMLEEAAHEQLVTGDMERAISLYHQVSESASASRANVAKALISLGTAYEIIGSSDAVVTYRRVVEEFSDQPSIYIAAQDALNRLYRDEIYKPTDDFTGTQDYSLIISDMDEMHWQRGRDFDVSPSGDVFVRPTVALDYRKSQFPTLHEELYFQEVGSNVLKPVLSDPGPWEFLHSPRISPDGSQIFFTANRLTEDGGERMWAIADVATGEIVHSNSGPDVSRMEATWMPDNAHLVTMNLEGFDVMSVDGTIVKHFDLHTDSRTHLGSVSPDGSSLVYHADDSRETPATEANVWMLNLESGHHTRITQSTGYEGWPIWNQDGSKIYYVSGELPTFNIYSISTRPNASPQKITAYSNAAALFPLILPETGQLIFGLTSSNNTIFASPSSSPDLARPLIRGAGPLLSPNADKIYYIDDSPGREGIWSATSEGTNPIHLVSGNLSFSYGKTPFLSPDGTHIAYFAFESGNSVLYTKSSSGGPAKKLYEVKGTQEIIAAWSPDSKELAFIDGPSLMVIPAQGGTATSLASQSNWESWMVEWSPDGKYIAGFAFTDTDEYNVIFAVNRTNGNLLRVTPPQEDQYKEILAWHPDGDQISYMYYGSDFQNDGTRIVPLTGGSPAHLVNMPDPMWDYIGTWGPDGKYYFVSSPRGAGNWALYSFDESTGDYEKVRGADDRSIGMPSWSGDGSTMTWHETQSTRQIWLLTDYE